MTRDTKASRVERGVSQETYYHSPTSSVYMVFNGEVLKACMDFWFPSCFTVEDIQDSEFFIRINLFTIVDPLVDRT